MIESRPQYAPWSDDPDPDPPPYDRKKFKEGLRKLLPEVVARSLGRGYMGRGSRKQARARCRVGEMLGDDALKVSIDHGSEEGAESQGQITRRYHVRNQQIVDAADEVFALVASDRKGGTEDTIRRAQWKGIPVTIL
jgi:hypothetical protein